jgi:hypothetical protein
MKNKFRAEFAIVLGVLVPWAFGQAVSPGSSTSPRYLVFDEGHISATNRELAQAIARGYHIVVAAPRFKHQNASGLTAILEKNHEGSPPQEYFLFEDQGGGLAQRVNDAAAKGYRVVARASFEHISHDYGADFRESLKQSLIDRLFQRPVLTSEDRVDHSRFDSARGYVLMESGGPRSLIPCRYSVLAPDQTVFLENRVQRGNRIVSAQGSLWVMESCSEVADAGTATSDPVTLRSLLLAGKSEKDQKALSLAAKDGFRVIYAAGPHLTLERSNSAAAADEYMIVSKGDTSSFEKRLNSAKGYRAIAGSLVMKHGDWGNLRLSAVLEKMPDSSISYQYRVLRKNADAGLQEQINKAAGQGYDVKDLATDGAGSTVLMERSSPANPFDVPVS